MRGLSLFTGVGGLDLAARAAGIGALAMCEADSFCRMMLAKRFPSTPVIDDVRNVDGKSFRGKADIVFGGFPCQDLSFAQGAERKGLEGERSGLWFEMARVIREARPLWVLAENVLGAVSLALDTVTENLEDAGYEVRALVLPAFAYGASQYRKRLFVCAARKDMADACRDRFQDGRVLPEDCVKGGALPIKAAPFNHGGEHRARDGGEDRAGESQRCLNPDWAEQLMAFPEGWTNPEVDDPAPWRGFPMRARLRRDAAGKWTSPQFPYEFPRLAPKGKWTEKRLRAIGNAVCPVQACPLFMAIRFMHDSLHECRRPFEGGGNDNSN